ncbi:MAG TPA: hypothetical protein VFE10_03595 [Phenylobacterium sp.]|nr:hypothetical protein [Phenylobacterium sp.]
MGALDVLDSGVTTLIVLATSSAVMLSVVVGMSCKSEIDDGAVTVTCETVELAGASSARAAVAIARAQTPASKTIFIG